jgi:histidine ammonia-lyase
VENGMRVVAIEALCAAQAIECRRPLRSGPRIEEAIARIRKLAPRLTEDRSLSPDIERVALAIRDGLLNV